MTPEEKSHAIQEFFLAPEPRRDSMAIVVGGGVALLGLLIASKSASPGFGLTVAVVGGLWALLMPLGTKTVDDEPENEVQYFSLARYSGAKARFEARPSTSQMVEWLREALGRLDAISQESLGLVAEDTTQDAALIVGPRFDAQIQGFALKDVLRRKVAEDKYFYSTFRVALFQFTDQFLGSYQADYNMIKNTFTSERAEEFFYRDVVSVTVSSDTTNFTLKSGDRVEHARTFTLGLTSGQRVEVVLDGAGLCTANELASLGDGAAANVRSMLRQYKELLASA